MILTSLGRTLVGVVVVTVAAPALAQLAASDPEAAARELRARQLYFEGSALYEADRYDEAIARFEEAYRLSARPALLFNIAQSYRRKGPGSCAVALRYYERNLEEEPGAVNRAEIEDLARQMRACVAAAALAPAPVPSVSAPSPAPEVRPVAGPKTLPVSRTLWPVVLSGAVAVAGAAGHTIVWAKYQSVRDGGPYADGTFRSWQLAGYVSRATLAAGLVSAGICALVFLPTPAARTHVGVVLDPEPRLGVTGRF